MKDFFDHQERARRSTWWLGLFFVLGVVGTVGSLLLLVGAIALVKAKGSASVESFDDLMRPEVGWAWAVAGLATLVILLVSLHRLWQLSRGGGAVAEMLGGRLVDRRTSDPAERRLLNVVDEMALASGVPVPPVYVLEEASINAFAAGTTHADAALGVTRGCIEQLDRDELQGVIAHEFSHVFHADMRINARTAAAIAGIMAIATIGYVLVRFVGPSIARSGGGGRKNNGAGIGVAIILAGLVLMVVGFGGSLFGTLLQAAMSRQREYLADASAVQYTRNPRGIAGALRKIKASSRAPIHSSHARDMNHFFFTNAAERWLSTHPPLDERIRRIEGLPADAPVVVDGTGAPPSAAAFDPSQRFHRYTQDGARGLVGAIGTMSVAPATQAAPSIAPPPPVPVEGAPSLDDAAHDPAMAPAIIACLLLSKQTALRERQLAMVAGVQAAWARQVVVLAPSILALEARARWELFDLACPTLIQVGPGPYRAMRQAWEQIVRADGSVCLEEWTIINALRCHVESQWSTRPIGEPRLRARELETEIRAVLWTLAASTGSDERAERAFNASIVLVRMKPGVPQGRPSLEAFATAIGRIGSAMRFMDRRLLVSACLECITNDQRVTDQEIELVRAICDSLGCPMPRLGLSAA
ncbi:MAG: M48 family metallopeptidase [Bacteroidia bacterium]|nr:M48 family metallopeptidase [Bacteroidia bacterium]